MSKSVRTSAVAPSGLPTRRHFAIRPVSLAAGLLLAAPASFGLPQGATPTFGQTTVKQTTPTQLDIRQTTPRAGIDWTRFSIGAGEKVVVTQPGSTSVLLNRVVGNDPSLIYGRLQSNGSVWLINPRGIVFGANSRVDVGSLVASTLSITSEDLASGRLLLGRGAGEPGELRSEGVINAPDGTVALIAPRITHTGSIDARRIGLAAASEVLVDVEGDGLIFFNARNDGLDTRLSLLGNVLANGGSVEARAVARASFADTVLNLEGIVQARSLGQREGRIVIDGGSQGITRVAGTLDATGNGVGQHGGDIVVLGEKVLIDRGATVDASGHAGGGQVRVGGDFQGKNPELHNASMVTVMPEAMLSANATGHGDGGRVIVWSDDATRFYGGVQARGGLLGGNGGFSEVSGKAYLDFQGTADLSAPLGVTGTLLLDPVDLTITLSTTAGSQPPLSGVGAGRLSFTDGGATSSVTAQRIVDLLTGTGTVTTSTNVVLQAQNTITVNADAPITASTGTRDLTLQAGNDVNVNAAISVRGNLTLSSADAGAGAGRDLAGSVTVNANLTALGSVNITNNFTGEADARTGTHVVAGTVPSPTTTITAPIINLTGSTDLDTGAVLRAAGTGITTVNVLAGTLDPGANNRISTSATVGVASGATLAMPGGNIDIVIGGLSDGPVPASGGTVTLDAANSLTVGGNNASTTFSGVISGGNNSPFIKQGTGTLTLAGTNTYTGSTTVSAGRLKLGDDSAAGSLANSSAITLSTASTILEISRSGTAAIANTISGTGSVINSGSGVVTLGVANSYTGTTTISGGTLSIADDDRLGTAPTSPTLGKIVLDGGTLRTTSSFALDADRGIALGAGTLEVTSGTLTYGGVIANGASTGILTKAGVGGLTLTGNNTYGGATNINAGRLTVDNTALPTGTAVVLADATAAELALTGSATIGSLAGGDPLVGKVLLGSFTLTTGSASNTTFSGEISGTGGLTKAGAGRLTLDGANIYSGATTVNAGTLTASGGAAIPDASAVTLANTAGVTLALSADETIGSLTGVGAASAAVTLGSNKLTTGGTSDTTFGGVISGPGGGSLTKVGTGRFTLTGANTYTGDTTISQGVLRAANSTALGTSAGTNTVANNAALELSGNITLADAITLNGTGVSSGGALRNVSDANTVSGPITLATASRINSFAGTLTLNAAGNAVTATDLGLTFGGAGNTTVVGAIATGAGALIKDGAGTLTLSGNNTFGTTTVNAGTLAVSGGAAIPDTSAVTLANTALVTLNLLADETIGSLDVGGPVGGNVTLGANTTLTTGAAGATTFAGAISGATGSIVKVGAGNFTLSGTNTYGGTTTVNEGTLTAAGVGGTPNAIPDGSAVTLANLAGVTLALSENETIGSLSGNGATLATVTLGDKTLTTGGASNTTFSGIISGSNGDLIKAGTGSFTLAGANDYTGGTTVSAGTLAINAAGVAGTGRITINRSATLDIRNAAEVTNAVTVNAVGTGADGTIANSAGTGILSGILTLSAATTVSSSSVVTALEISNDIVGGAQALTKTGNGTVTLSGTNVFGTTTVSAGILAASGGAAIPDASAVTLANATGVTLALSANETIGSLAGGGANGGNVTLGANRLTTDGVTLTPFGGIISGNGGSLTKTGSGTLTLTRANTYDGGTTVSGGTLAISGTAGTAGANSGGITLANGTTLDIISGATVTNAVTSDRATIGNSAGAGFLSTGGLTLDGNSTVSSSITGANTGLTINAAITGATFNLTKSGAGTVTLAGSNNFANTSITGGTLSVNGGAAIPDTSAVTLANTAGVTLNLLADETIGSLSGVGATLANVTLGTNTLTTGSASNTTFSGIISGNNGNLIKAGTGRFTLAGANDYTGDTTINAGVLRAASNTALGTFDGTNTVANNAALELFGGITLADAITLNGTGVSSGGALRNFSGDNTVSGTITLTTASRINSDAGTLLTLNAAGNAVTATNVALTMGGAGETAMTGAIAIGAGALTKDGTGTVTLSGNNTFGTTTVNAGTLAVGGGAAIPNGSAVTLANTAGVTLNLLTNETIGSLSGVGATLANVTLGANRLTTGGATTFGGVISGPGGTLTKTGPGRFTLTGANTYDGGTTVSVGTLAISGTGTAGASSGGITLANGTTLDIISGATVNNAVTSNGATIGNTTGAGFLSTGGLTLGGNSTVSSSGTGTNPGLTINAAITGATFNLTKSGAGTVTLAGSNTHVDTNLTAGTLAISGAGTGGTGTLTLAAGSTLDIINGAIVSNAVSSAGGTINNSVGLGRLQSGGVTLTADSTVSSSSADGLEISANIGGSGALTKTGTGTVTLSGNNSYDGSTTVSAGTLALASASAVPAGSAVILADVSGALLDVQGNTTIGSLAGGGVLGGWVALTANTLTAGGDNTNTNYGGRISGNTGRLIKAGTGSLTLTGNSGYDGDTEVSVGTLVISGVGAVAGTSTIGVAGGATLDIVAGATVNNAVRLDGGTLANSTGTGTLASSPSGGLELTAPSTFRSAGDGMTISAAISGAGGFTKTGSAALTLSNNNNNYAGATTVSAGALTVSGGNAIGDASAVTLANTTGVSLTLLAGETIGSLTGTGTGANVGNVALGANTLVTGGNNGDTTYAGVISSSSNSGGLTKEGTGIFTVTGANTYTGPTTVNGGTLAVRNTLASTIVGINAGTLSTNAANLLADSAAVSMENGGTLALGGSETFRSLAGAGGSVTLASGTLTTGGTNSTTTFGGAISGAGGLTKTGSGTLTLSGNHSYAGVTTVTGGVLALQGTLDSATLNVSAGRLTTSATNLLADNAVLTVAAGASAAIGGDDSILRLSLAGTLDSVLNSVLNGSVRATLTATETTLAAYTLAGGTANANLGTGRLVSTGNSAINGSSDSLDVTVSSGNLTLGSGSNLADTAAVTVSLSAAPGTTLTLGGDDTIGTLELEGTLAGTGTLTATTYTLVGATVGASAGLGTGSLTTTGETTFSGRVDADELTVATDPNLSTNRLEITGANLLSSNAVLTVLTGADLRLLADQTVGSLNLTGETSGPGVLSASNFSLNNATYNGNLGSGDLVSNGTSRINGSAASVTLLVASGSLTLAGSGSMTAAPDVTVADTALLVLLRNERFGSIGGPGDLQIGRTTAPAILATLTTGSNQGSTFAGVISGPGSLVKEGAGTVFTLSGANDYTGTTTVAAGTLALDGPNRLGNTGVTVATGATLRLNGSDTVASLNLSGTLGGTGTLTADTYNLSGGNTTATANLGAGTLNSTLASRLRGTSAADIVNVDTGTLTLVGAGRFTSAPDLVVDAGATLAMGGNETVGTLAGTAVGALAGRITLGSGTLTTGSGGASSFAGAITGLGGLTKQGSGVFTLTGANTYSGATQVNAGTLALVGSNRLGNGTTVTVAEGATLSLGGTDTVAALNLAGTLAGNGTLIATNGYNLDAGRTNAGANLGAGSLTSNGDSTLGGTSAAGVVTIATGSLTLGAANRLADSAAVSVAAGSTLQMAADDTIGALTAGGTLAGTGTLTAASYTLDGATVGLNLGAGTLDTSGDTRLNGTSAADAVNVNAGTLRLGGVDRLSNNATVVVADGARLLMTGSDTVASLLLAGTLEGAGTLTAASYSLDGGEVNAVNLGTGTLNSAGASLLAGNSAAGVVNVTEDRLTLADGGTFTAAPALTLGSGAALTLGGNETVGSLAGGGSVALGAARLTTGSGASTTYAGVISGGGSLRKQGASTFTLAGANTYTGATVVEAGTLALAAANRLANATDVTVASGATLSMNGSDTVGSLTLDGTLDRTPDVISTLTAATYALDSASVNANLGAGSLVSTGDTTLRGSSGASSVAVNSGRLTLGSGNRLAGNAALSIADGATVALTGSDSIGSLALAGTLTGTGTLTAATYALDGAAVNAKLGTGALTSTGASTLAATSAAGTVNIDSGSLTLAGVGGFTAAPALAVAAGSTLALSSSQTLGSLAGNGNVTLGSTTLSTGAGGSTTFGGVLSGSGRLVKQGNTTFTLAGDNTFTGSTTVAGGTLAVDGTLASGTVAVNAGSLNLGAPDRLIDTAALTVADGATLTMGGNERVASLVLAGTLDGTGTLTAATYALNGGSASAGLGVGALTSTGDSRLAGTSAATTVSVDSGVLNLASANRLRDSAAVTVARDARLNINGNDTIGSLTLSGTLDGSGVLTAASYRLAGGTASADLGSGALTSTGDSTLAGVSAADRVRIDTGTLTLQSPGGGIGGRFSAAPAVTVDGGSTLSLGGNETFGTLTGSGTIALGSATLATGSAGSTTFDGVITGVGALRKQGDSTFTLTGASTYTGSTTIEAGTLSVGNGGTTGALRSSDIVVNGILRMNRDDATTLSAAVRGSGSIEKAGDGTLTLSGRNKRHTGETIVSAGELATSAAGDLWDTRATTDRSAVRVNASARLSLAGDESVRSIDADGTVVLGGNLDTGTGNMRLAGPTSVLDNRAITLSGANIDATNDGNRWGSRLSVSSPGAVLLSSGLTAGTANDLLLGSVDVGNGGRIDAGKLTLDGNLSLGGGSLQLVSSAAQVISAPGDELDGKLANARPVAFAEDVVIQTANSVIDVANGARLAVVAPSGGSIQLTSTGNRFAGLLSVRSGEPNAPWDDLNLATLGGLTYALQGRVRVNGSTVNIGAGGAEATASVGSLAGVEADVVEIRADQLTTAPASGSDPRATIVARLPFDNSVGTEQSLPGLTLELSPVAFTLPFPFGLGGDSREVNINVGNRAFGSRTLALDSGYLRVLPRGGAQGSTVVILSGPSQDTGYQFFFDGAGQAGEIPVFYNGVSPSTPQLSGSISAIVSVTESARRERFEEAVRTENVAIRLRAGVIAEVGPGRPATQGSEGAKPPLTCAPAPGSLGCAPAVAP